MGRTLGTRTLIHLAGALRRGIARRPSRPARDRIIVFTRYPVPGATKTRMIPALGPDGAAMLHRALTEHTLQQARRFAAAEIEVHWTGGDEESMRAWIAGPLRIRKQCEGDLGARMTHALLSAFDEGVARAVLVGCDSPDLGPETYEAAFAALSRVDVVIGPAADGGYYLIGARAAAADRLHPLFADIDWGTDRVLEQTLSRIGRAGLTYTRTAVLDDIDRPEDLRVWDRHRDPAAKPWLSVIIPALNEAVRIGATLESIANSNDIEIIVVDGGSTDGTPAIAAERGARVYEAPRGRAHQMNLGAAKAAGEILLFLHADTRLPVGHATAIRECLARPGAIAGAFSFATDLDSPAMRLVTAFAAVRARMFELPYGDQGLFVPADVFRRAGGFPTMPIMEDFEFVRRLRRFGHIEIADRVAVTSGDRWRRLGVWRTTLRNARIVTLYLLGTKPEQLLRIYRRGDD